MRLLVVLRQDQTGRPRLDRARELETAGADMIGIPEAYGIDAVSQLGYLAARTERVELMAQVLPIFTRTPALIAMTAAGLDEVSGGRFVLGLGASGPQVISGWHGLKYDEPIARTTEIVEICRTVWQRDKLDHHGRHYDVPAFGASALRMIHHPGRPRIPIHLAALGPRNVAFAAAHAEGWIPFIYFPERAAQAWGEAVRSGLNQRAPGLGPLDIIAGGTLAVTTDRAGPLQQVRRQLALYIGGMGSSRVNFYRNLMDRYGFGADAERVRTAFLAGDRDGAAELLPATLVDGVSLVGERSYLVDRLHAYADTGVTILRVDVADDNAMRDVGTLRELMEGIALPGPSAATF